MCGIVGVVTHGQANQYLYDALTVLQHRGQDAAGIATCQGQHLSLRKAGGFVRDVFLQKHMEKLTGNMGIGHVRYPTAGSITDEQAQPFYVNAPYGIVLAHNGNLINAKALRDTLATEDLRHVNTDSDSEIILNVFASALNKTQHETLTPEHIFDAVRAVHARCKGGYAVTAMILGVGLVAFRDPNGIRPLVYGTQKIAGKTAHMLASESVALNINEFQKVSDIAPGEAIFITEQGEMVREQCATSPKLTPCIFEFVYFARPDSFLDNISVYKVRLRLGQYLAQQIQTDFSYHDIEVVMPIPDTSCTAAFSLAQALNVKYREGFVKNRYIGRTFIMPGQQQRKQSVRRKLNTIDLEFEGKNVLLVDDSIVRGTTSTQIIQMARQAGAKKVYLASAAPPVIYPNVYGIDMPTQAELIASGKSISEIETLIGADKLIYLRLEHLIAAAQEGNASITRFEDSVFTGDYLTGDVDQTYLDAIALERSDAAKQKAQQAV